MRAYEGSVQFFFQRDLLIFNVYFFIYVFPVVPFVNCLMLCECKLWRHSYCPSYMLMMNWQNNVQSHHAVWVRVTAALSFTKSGEFKMLTIVEGLHFSQYQSGIIFKPKSVCVKFYFNVFGVPVSGTQSYVCDVGTKYKESFSFFFYLFVNIQETDIKWMLLLLRSLLFFRFLWYLKA